MGYIYQADTYCESCGATIRENLRAQGKAPVDSMDHSSYDSDNFPKDARVEREEADSPQHCASCHTFMHNPLTSAGYAYVKQSLDESKIARLDYLPEPLHSWAAWYGFTYWTAEECAEDGRHEIAGWYSTEAY